ncbi:MAG TPA: peptide-methionine (S)-S-oxide reductase MsrA [Candidatus Paceibacterota bacterium]|nr:peptide-methionine (S)-S-oxide reductase MsrA [Candidatus Paceibacterota bacterium]
MNTAVFAGGCFWCVEHDLKAVPGVISVVSGYVGPESSTPPSYENHAGYREAVIVTYDPKQVSYKKLCQFFLDHIDPTDSGGQFHDRGEAYKTAMYYVDETEQAIAESLIHELDESGLFDSSIAVDVLALPTFYNAEDYHQDYADKNPVRYGAYAAGSGRVAFVAQTCDVREQKKIQWKD